MKDRRGEREGGRGEECVEEGGLEAVCIVLKKVQVFLLTAIPINMGWGKACKK